MYCDLSLNNGQPSDHVQFLGHVKARSEQAILFQLTRPSARQASIHCGIYVHWQMVGAASFDKISIHV